MQNPQFSLSQIIQLAQAVERARITEDAKSEEHRAATEQRIAAEKAMNEYTAQFDKPAPSKQHKVTANMSFALESNVPLPPRPSPNQAEHWNAAMRFIGGNGPTTLAQVTSHLEGIGHIVQQGTLRSQFANFTNSGWLQRVDKGVFVLTPKGAERCGYKGTIVVNNVFA